MKKKILFVLGALSVAAILNLNVSLVQNAHSGTLSLDSLLTFAKADVDPIGNGKALYSDGSTFCCKPKQDHSCYAADC